MTPSRTRAHAGPSKKPSGPIVNSLTTGQLPKFVELYVMAGSLIVIGGVMLLMGFNVGGWIFLSIVLYLVALAVLSSVAENRRRALDRIVRSLVSIAFLLAIAPLVSTLVTVTAKGIGEINWGFISKTGGAVFNPDTLKVDITAGALQAIVGTLIITGIAALMSIPIGILTSIYLVEYAKPGSWMARTVTFLVDVMTGIPSIVAGLFAFSLFTLLVGPKAFSGFSASVALSVLMIPIVVRSCEEMLRLVPHDLREASLRARRLAVLHDHRRSCCPPLSRALSPASCSPSPA